MDDRETHALDNDFLHIVRLAARGEPEKLQGYLLSDRPIGRGERLALADLISGEWRRGRGRRSEADKREAWREVQTEYNRLRDEAKARGERPSREKLCAQVAERCNLTADRVHEYVNRSRSRK